MAYMSKCYRGSFENTSPNIQVITITHSGHCFGLCVVAWRCGDNILREKLYWSGRYGNMSPTKCLKQITKIAIVMELYIVCVCVCVCV